MSVYFKALLMTLVFGALMGIGFYKWKSNFTKSDGETRIGLIDKMEREGLIDLSAKSLDGRDFRLFDMRGKVVILNFWASWCAPCVEEIPSMVKLVNGMNGSVVLVAVSQDSSREEVEIFLKAFPEIKSDNIYVLLDSDRSIGKLYNADRLPESYIARKDLKLEKKIIGSIDWAAPEAFDFMRGLLDR